MKNKQVRFRKIRRAAKKAAGFLGATVLAASLMFGSGKAQAQEKKDAKPVAVKVEEKKDRQKKLGLGISLGAGHEFVSQQPRAFAQIDANIQLPLKSSIFAAFGLNMPLRGAERSISVEELDIYLNTQLHKRLGLFAGGYISKHLWVDSLSPEGGISANLPAGFSAAASYVYLVGLERPHLLLAKIGRDFLDGKLGIVTKWAYTIDSSGSGRIGIFVKPKEDFPKIGIDTIVIFNQEKVMFADMTLNSSWSF